MEEWERPYTFYFIALPIEEVVEKIDDEDDLAYLKRNDGSATLRIGSAQCTIESHDMSGFLMRSSVRKRLGESLGTCLRVAVPSPKEQNMMVYAMGIRRLLREYFEDALVFEDRDQGQTE